MCLCVVFWGVGGITFSWKSVSLWSPNQALHTRSKGLQTFGIVPLYALMRTVGWGTNQQSMEMVWELVFLCPVNSLGAWLGARVLLGQCRLLCFWNYFRKHFCDITLHCLHFIELLEPDYPTQPCRPMSLEWNKLSQRISMCTACKRGQSNSMHHLVSSDDLSRLIGVTVLVRLDFNTQQMSICKLFNPRTQDGPSTTATKVHVVPDVWGFSGTNPKMVPPLDGPVQLRPGIWGSGSGGTISGFIKAGPVLHPQKGVVSDPDPS